MSDPLPYREWPTNEHQRWITLGHMFGRHLMQHVRGWARSQIPADTPRAERAAAEQGIDNCLYAFMDFLDGYWLTKVDERHRVEYALVARIRDEEDEVIETVELAPGGDGLSLGIHEWLAGDFGRARRD